MGVKGSNWASYDKVWQMTIAQHFMFCWHEKDNPMVACVCRRCHKTPPRLTTCDLFWPKIVSSKNVGQAMKFRDVDRDLCIGCPLIDRNRWMDYIWHQSQDCKRGFIFTTLVLVAWWQRWRQQKDSMVAISVAYSFCIHIGRFAILDWGCLSSNRVSAALGMHRFSSQPFCFIFMFLLT